MILSAKINNSLSTNFELNFITKTWSLPASSAKWGGVMFSDRGTFKMLSGGTIWLMDGRNGTTDSAVILHKAPSGENDLDYDKGTGRVYAPATVRFRDCTVQWNVVKREAAAGAAGKTSGLMTKVRIKAEQIARSLVPPMGKLSNGQRPANAKGTGCGEFPGRVLRRIPVKLPPKGFSLNVQGAGVLYLTSPTTHWENFAKAIDAKFNPAKKLWVDFTGSNRPKTGDIYLLAQWDKRSDFQHVGMIISCEGSDWVTADGGQGNGFQSGLIPRKFHGTSGQIDGEFGNKAYLKGWVDLDNLKECLSQEFPPDV